MENDLETENKQLRRQLKAFVAQARENEAKLQRFKEYELALISATSIAELLHLVLNVYPETFHLDCISLILLDPEYELVRMMEAGGSQLEEMPNLLVETEASVLQAYFPNNLLPRIGPDTEGGLHLFPPQTQTIRSHACLPMLRNDELVGILNLGSYDPQRFMPGSGTEFLERLASIVAICLDNCANHQRVKQLGLTDPLTKVNNRRYFDQRLGEEATRVQRHQQPLSCMFLDVDFFKRINDTQGHQAGDRVLQQVAQLIGKQLRHSDILSRYGGEEFVVLLPSTPIEDCREIAERIRQGIAAHAFDVECEEPLRLTISIGLCCLEHIPMEQSPQDYAQSMLACADQAVYQAKESGRDRVCSAPFEAPEPVSEMTAQQRVS
jgi:two-component system, cell cycle response regulator